MADIKPFTFKVRYKCPFCEYIFVCKMTLSGEIVICNNCKSIFTGDISGRLYDINN